MSQDNPAGTLGFDFLEFSTPNLDKLKQQFSTLGLTAVAHHQSRDVILFQQNDIRFFINTHKNAHAEKFSREHGPSVCSMGFKVKNAKAAYEYVLSKGAKAYLPTQNEKIYDLPAIYGIGGSLIYFVDYNEHQQANYAHQLAPLPYDSFAGHGLTYIDHVTHNLFRGNMNEWANFYTELFNFKEVRYFDIEGKLTGLLSRAMASPCGNIRIPLNESSDDKSQIEEFLKDFNGQGIQHIALGTHDIYASVEGLHKADIRFLDTPDTYYELINERLPHHNEPIERLKKNRILIDGSTDNETIKILLQIFTQNMLGPVFFEVIQRKGDDGFGEGNFKALFESIELDQIRRGVIS